MTHPLPNFVTFKGSRTLVALTCRDMFIIFIGARLVADHLHDVYHHINKNPYSTFEMAMILHY